MRFLPSRRLRPRTAIRTVVRFFTPNRRSPLSALPLLALVVCILDALTHYVITQPARPSHALDEPFQLGCREPEVDAPREAAAIVMLARNSDLEEAIQSVVAVEERFNRWFHYPWVFLNDHPWSAEFVARINETATGGAIFHQIPKDSWGYPDGFDVDWARAQFKKQQSEGILYGGVEGYHHMCRFFSGNFFNLDILKPYKYYWRIEPGIKLFCDITYDPFRLMALKNKLYGWTMALGELPHTVPTLFRATMDWKEANKIPSTPMWRATVRPLALPLPIRKIWAAVAPNTDRQGDMWSLCHYWSNFEIANLDWFRGEKYQSYYRWLNKQGGFYGERWGDAPVHSLAVAMLMDGNEVHHFNDIGYQHDRFWTCPANNPDTQLPGSLALSRTKPTNQHDADKKEEPSTNEDDVTHDPDELHAKADTTSNDNDKHDDKAGDKRRRKRDDQQTSTQQEYVWDEERPEGIGCRCSCPHGADMRSNIRPLCVDRLKAPTIPKERSGWGWWS